jgi:putative transposase
MRTGRFSEEQIIGVLKEAEAGVTAKEICRKHGFAIRHTAVGERCTAGWKSVKREVSVRVRSLKAIGRDGHSEFVRLTHVLAQLYVPIRVLRNPPAS